MNNERLFISREKNADRGDEKHSAFKLIPERNFMSKQKQKEAVFSAIEVVLTQAGMSIGDNKPVADMLNSESRQQVANILVEGFNAGTIELSTEFADQTKLRSYVSGLISNWLRKDSRLNGGVKYVPVNPGSRAYTGDNQLKALRALLDSGKVTDAGDQDEIRKAITARIEELKPKAPAVQVDYSALPEHIRNKFTK